jgi:hypothetical protein
MQQDNAAYDEQMSASLAACNICYEEKARQAVCETGRATAAVGVVLKGLVNCFAISSLEDSNYDLKAT